MIEHLPAFSTIDAESIESELTALLTNSRETISHLKKVKNPNYDNFILPLELINNRIDLFFSPIRHLNSVADTNTLRKSYEKCLPMLSAFETDISQDTVIYTTLKTIQRSSELTDHQRRNLELRLKDLELAGVGLDAADKAAFKTNRIKLAELSQTFDNHVLDATLAFEWLIQDKEQLKGLPDSDLALFKAKAAKKNQEGYLLTLDAPAYHAIMTYADNRTIREKLFHAYVTLASELGSEQYDNNQTIEKILALKRENARLLGFSRHADVSLATKMAESPEKVLTFLENLAHRAKPFAQKEMEVLKAFALEDYGIKDFSSWDMSYISEKYRQKYFSLSEEVIRQYFPVDRVIEGLFTITQRLYGVTISECSNFDSYHPDARLFEIKKDSKPVAKFYLDLYAREHKKSGAWMDTFVNRLRDEKGQVQMPVAALTCNFKKGNEALLTHNEVTTLFHEFGHGLHLMLTTLDTAGISGISGVEWDAVELPSQFMENYCWEREGLALISRHIETGKTLPDDLLEALQQARSFNSGYAMLRQLEFGLFDMLVHTAVNPINSKDVLAILQNVREQVSPLLPPDYDRFQCKFRHIFTGGYAAGYYSYKWAEVLSSDAFSAFEENGIFDKATGQSFLQHILGAGSSRKMADAFVAFRGQEPGIEALLRHAGLSQQR